MKQNQALKGTIKWVCILASIFLLGLISHFTQQNIWIEATAKFFVGFLIWFLLSFVLDVWFPIAPVPTNHPRIEYLQLGWEQLRLRQSIWEATSWSYFILIVRYGYQMGAGTHPMLTIWNLVIVSVVGYIPVWLAGSVFKKFKCPNCHQQFFRPDGHPKRSMVFDPSLSEWPNESCIRCGLKIWTHPSFAEAAPSSNSN